MSTQEITIDAVGDNANEARGKALARGERDAFEQLIYRLDPQGAEAKLASISPSKITTFVLGFEVIEEKIAANRYRARIRYNFNPDVIRTLVGNAVPAAAPEPDAMGQPPAVVSPPSNAVLVLPVMRDGESVTLWEPSNFWRSIWNNAALEVGRGDLIMPYGDPTDMQLIQSATVLGANYATLKPLMDRYGTQTAIVVSAVPKQDTAELDMEVFIRFLAPEKTEANRAAFTAQEEETLQTMMIRAAYQVADRVMEKVSDRVSGVAANLPTARLKALAYIQHISEWKMIKAKLEALPAIAQVDVDSVGFQKMEMELVYQGSPEYLGQSLIAAGFKVSKKDDRLLLTTF